MRAIRSIAGALDVAADAEEACAAVAYAAELGVGLAAIQEDMQGVGDGLGIVVDCGAAAEADDGREWRLDSWHRRACSRGIP